MFIEWRKTEMWLEIKPCCTTENIDSKFLIMLEKWYHFSSQWKSVLLATFKSFYVWKSFAKCIQVSDGKNKFTMMEFFKSVNIKDVIEYHGWSMGSNFLILQHWILKKVMLSFYSRFSMLWVGRRNERTERAISCTGRTMQLWWTWGGGHSAVLTAKERRQMN